MARFLVQYAVEVPDETAFDEGALDRVALAEAPLVDARMDRTSLRVERDWSGREVLSPEE